MKGTHVCGSTVIREVRGGAWANACLAERGLNAIAPPPAWK